MAVLLFHEHPRQRGACLQGAFASYVERIPIGEYADLDAVWRAIQQRPFEPDLGDYYGLPPLASCLEPPSRIGRGDARCSPAQRSRVWPAMMNCWEATAHFVAGARVFLDERWTVHVWDRDLQSGARHLWPSLVTPRGGHILVDLRTTARREYPTELYSGSYPSRS